MSGFARLTPSSAAAKFQALCDQHGVGATSIDILAAWNVFRQFSETPVERTLEGASFGFQQAKFERPNGPLYLSFTRYWYTPGQVSETAYVAQFSFRFAFEPDLVPLSVELETVSNAVDPITDLETMREFIQQAESNAELWRALQVRTPTHSECYVGPQ